MKSPTCSTIFLLNMLSLGSAQGSFAQNALEIGQPLPFMEVVFCATLEGARILANQFWHAGRVQPLEPRLFEIDKGTRCVGTRGVITPLAVESAIQPFNTWIDKLDPVGSGTALVNLNGKIVEVQTSAAIGQVRVYRGNIVMENGEGYYGFILIPDQPYSLEFVEMQKRRR